MKEIKRHRYYLASLTLVSGVCFWLAWPPNQCVPLLFGAFVPLLLIERHIATHSYRFAYRTYYKYVYLTLFIWNLSTTWWVAYATIAGAVFMLLVNSFFMSLPFPLFQWTIRHRGRFVGYLSLVAYWVSMEHIHCHWQLSFPWLNLGNGLACFPQWAQWYEYTGVLGGTIWILMANLLLFQTLLETTVTRKKRWMSLAGVWVLLPILCSYYVYTHYEEQGKDVEVVVMQPNINPSTGALADTDEILSTRACVDHFIRISETELTEKTQFLVWPEVAIDSLFNERVLRAYPLIDKLVDFQSRYPRLSLLLGINSLVGYPNKATKTVRFSERYGYYDVFNTALFIGDHGLLDTYHKSRLVPGAELIPYLYSLQLPSWLVPGLGGTLRSLGVQDCPHVFSNKEGINVAPAICYESIYGDHLANFVRKGASLIFSMTIDGWWRDTPGYRQHFHYTRLRAIENRKSIARSALKGISAFISQRGAILQAARYSDQVALRHTLRANSTLTFYARNSIFIPTMAISGSCIMVLLAFTRRYSRNVSRYNRKRNDLSYL